MYDIKIRRAYSEKGRDDGYRILVDRLWPRGIKKEELSFSWWPKELAPSEDLREWFDHDANKFNDFKKAYKKELAENELKNELMDKVKTQLYSFTENNINYNYIV